MSLLITTLFPHMSLLIEGLEKNTLPRERFTKTLESINTLNQLFNDLDIDTIIIIDPHPKEKVQQDTISIINSKKIVGAYKSSNNNIITCDFFNDLELCDDIINASKNIFPISESYKEDIGKVKWGTIVPMWFMGNNNRKGVVISPNIKNTEVLVTFGKMLSEVSEKSDKKIAILISYDSAHTHSDKGKYGYHPSAARYDELLVNCIKSNKLEVLEYIPQELIRTARPDSCQLLPMLSGICKENKNSYFLSYEVPTYCGLVVSYFL